MAAYRNLPLLFAFGASIAGCFVEHRPSYNSSYNPPVDQGSSIPTCPTTFDPAVGVSIDTDVGPKLIAGSGEGVSVEYSSGGLWHVQSTCGTPSSGYRCMYDVTAQVFNGNVSNVTAEELESEDVGGSSCPDTAYMLVTTGADVDGMIFTTAPGATVRITAALDQKIYPNLIYFAKDGAWHNDANANPLDLTPVSP